MGAQPKRIKLSIRLARDSKVQALSEVDQRRLHMLLVYLSQHSRKDATDKYLSFYMRIPEVAWLATKARLLEADLIAEGEDGLQVGAPGNPGKK